MIEFKKTIEFPKGTFYKQLVDAYSFNNNCKKTWNDMWKEYDEFFYSNRMITLEFLLYSHPEEYKECFKQFENNNVYNLISDENGTIDIWGYKYTKEEA